MLNIEAYRILIIDTEGVLNGQLKVFLEGRGFLVQRMTDAMGAKKAIVEWKPHFILVDLLFPDFNALQVIKYVKETPSLSSMTRVIVCSNHNNKANVKTAIVSGAVDYWVKPLDFDNVASRLVFQLSRRGMGAIDDPGAFAEKQKLSGPHLQFYLTDLLLQEAQKMRPTQESVYNLTRMLALSLKSVRTSCIVCDSEDQTGWVVASSDDAKLSGLKLNLSRYPEVNHVLITEKMVVIENMDYDPRLQQVRNNVKSISFNAMVVCPVFRRGELFGVLSTRMGLEHKSFNEMQVRFARMVAVAAGFALERDPRIVASEFATPAPIIAPTPSDSPQGTSQPTSLDGTPPASGSKAS